MARRRYSPGFRADAVKFVFGSDRSVTDIAEHLDIHPMTLGNWVRKEKDKTGGVFPAGILGVTPERELHRLRAEKREWARQKTRLEVGVPPSAKR